MGQPRRRTIRVGVVGVGRGMSFARGASEVAGMKLVALCDIWKEKVQQVGKNLRVTAYTDFNRFLEHDMDAVVLANYFHQHTPLALQALARGLHVMSETATHTTLAEGAALCEAVKRSGCIYMLAENYPYSAACQELRRLYQQGRIGQVRYAEGEYIHPMETLGRLRLSPGLKHWRNWLPPTYYCSHALAPLMLITGLRPVQVNCLAFDDATVQAPRTVVVADTGAVLLVLMDNGAVFRIVGLRLNSIHRTRYELHGERGLLATAEPNHWSYVRVHHENWLKPVDAPRDTTYQPDWPEHGELAAKAGHGGGDFWTSFHFANAIRCGKQPDLDVYRGTAMCNVGIQAWRSALAGGAPMAVPDFRKAAARKQAAEDHWSPWPDGTGDGQAPPCLGPIPKPCREAIGQARKVWRAMGYQGK